MTIKQQVLLELINANGESVSGQALADKLFCSRNAVWKAIKMLKSQGYQIEATTNKGYSLKSSDVISVEQIREKLKYDCDIILFDEIDSTNNYLKILAEKGATEKTVVIAKSQTSGKGRLGRTFHSSLGGVYMSLLLRPSFSAKQSLFVTTAAAVAVAKAIENKTGNKTGIKWVNDIFIDNKKVCGILTEASIDFETGGLMYAVLGIGINIKKPKDDFPDEIKQIAGVISEDEVDVSGLVAEVINNFFEIYYDFENSDFMNDYREKSFVIGKRINVIRGEQKIPAKALDIDNDARILVEYESGEREYLSSGEVSVRL